MFFLVLFSSTVGTKKINESKSYWHSGWWASKVLLWMSLMFAPFFLPSEFSSIYGKIAGVGAGVFLIVQLIGMIQLINRLSNFIHSERYAERCHIPVTIITITAYGFSIVSCIMMYIMYAPKLSCRLNILFITLTLLLLLIITFASMHHKVRVGYLSPGLMGAYFVFLCWCAIRSEPQTESCNLKGETVNDSDWLTIVSFIIEMLLTVFSTFSMGTNSKNFQFKKAERNSDDVPYDYGIFHLLFAMGSMYSGMLFVGWDAHTTLQKWTIDVGWASTWVKIGTEWLAAVIYLLMLVVPHFWKRSDDDRV